MTNHSKVERSQYFVPDDILSVLSIPSSHSHYHWKTKINKLDQNYSCLHTETVRIFIIDTANKPSVLHMSYHLLLIVICLTEV
jgi:hypothetical protein